MSEFEEEIVCPECGHTWLEIIDIEGEEVAL